MGSKKKKKAARRVEATPAPLDQAEGRENYPKSEQIQADIVDIIEANGAMPVPELARDLGVSIGSAYYQVKKLVLSKRARLAMLPFRGQLLSWVHLPGQTLDEAAAQAYESRIAKAVVEQVETAKAAQRRRESLQGMPDVQLSDGETPRYLSQDLEMLANAKKRRAKTPTIGDDARTTLRQLEVQAEMILTSVRKLRAKLDSD